MSIPTSATPGLLLVFGEPGPAVSDAEFNDWYDNEHVPLRVAVPGFQSWIRAAAADARYPRYAAWYDVTSQDVLFADAYTSLARTRSARETDIIARIRTLDRRVYSLAAESEGMAVGLGGFVALVEPATTSAEEGVQRPNGALRSRRFALASALGGQEADPAQELLIHEWASADDAKGWAPQGEVRSVRTFVVSRIWDKPAE